MQEVRIPIQYFNKRKIIILGDVEVPKNAPNKFLAEKHKQFLLACGRDRVSHEYIMAEYLRMSGIYWCLAALDVLNEAGDELDKEFIVNYIRQNKRDDGGYAAAEGHDSHLLHTLSAVQLSIIINRIDTVSKLIQIDSHNLYFRLTKMKQPIL